LRAQQYAKQREFMANMRPNLKVQSALWPCQGRIFTSLCNL